MPKISEAGGPTDETQPGYYEPGRSFQSPNVARKGDDVSPGSSSPRSDSSTVTNEQNEQPASPPTAPETGGRSKRAQTGRSTASTGATRSPATGVSSKRR